MIQKKRSIRMDGARNPIAIFGFSPRIAARPRLSCQIAHFRRPGTSLSLILGVSPHKRAENPPLFFSELLSETCIIFLSG